MCRHCQSYGYAGLGGFGGMGGFGFDMFDDGIGRAGFNTISNRAMKAEDKALEIFHKFVVNTDCSQGPVTKEIIQFHLVPKIRKSFGKQIRAEGFNCTHRQLSREEQDKINKSRKSLMWYTSCTINQAAKDAWIAKNPTTAAQYAQTASTSSTPAKAPLKKRDANEMCGQASANSSKKAKKAKA